MPEGTVPEDLTAGAPATDMKAFTTPMPHNPWKDAVNAIGKDNDALLKDNERLTKDNAALVSTNTAHHAEIERLKNSVGCLDQINERKRRELEDVSERHNNLAKSLRASHEDCRALELDRDAVVAERDSQGVELGRLKAEIIGLKRKSDDATMDDLVKPTDTFIAALHNAGLEIDRLKRNIGKLDEVNEAQRCETDRLKQDNHNLRGELETVRWHRDTAESDLQHARAHIAVLNDRVKHLEQARNWNEGHPTEYKRANNVTVTYPDGTVTRTHPRDANAADYVKVHGADQGSYNPPRWVSRTFPPGAKADGVTIPAEQVKPLIKLLKRVRPEVNRQAKIAERVRARHVEDAVHLGNLIVLLQGETP